MRRVLSVWLPTFSTDLAKRRLTRRESGGPADPRASAARRAIIITRPVASREMVAHRCAVALRAGVSPGMDFAHARSLVPPGVELHKESERAERDGAALHALACWALRVAPLVAPDPPDGLLIDISGTQRLHRGEERILRSLGRALERHGFAARASVASTFGCAWAAARFGPHPFAIVAPGKEREVLRGLPVRALRIDEKTSAGLHEIGILTVGHVLDLPRKSLPARFDGPLLRRLLQALGEAGEEIEPVRPPPPVESQMIFEGPTDHSESVLAAAERVLHRLAAQLATRESGLRRLDVALLRPRAQPTRLEVNLSRPNRSARHLWSLLRPMLERVDLGDGVEGVSMTAARTARVRHEQRCSEALGGEDAAVGASAWGELIDTLSGRLGAERVVRLEPVESHLPERAFRERPALEDPPREEPGKVTGADRPTVLLPWPEPAEAMALTPDGPLLNLGWRGKRWGITACAGPERVAQEWWRWPGGKLTNGQMVKWSNKAERPPDRDYYRVQTECGRWLWVFRHVGTGRWFVHGEWS